MTQSGPLVNRSENEWHGAFDDNLIGLHNLGFFVKASIGYNEKGLESAAEDFDKCNF